MEWIIGFYLVLIALVAISGCTQSTQSVAPATPIPTTATYVLVMGGNMTTETWNKLTIGKPVYTQSGYMGAKIWDGTVNALEEYNYRVFAPALIDEQSSNLTDQIDQISKLIVENDLRNVILVGHSYGGMIITGVADQMPDRISRLVYVDAALPDPGQSLYDILNMSLSGPPGSLPVLPGSFPPYVEKLQYDPAKIQPIPKTYIRCTKSDYANVTYLAKEKIAADPEGWTYIELPSSHVPMADMPGEFYQLLLDAARK